jgi:hypothetical protein
MNGPMNQLSHPVFQAISDQFPLSQRERAGVRENHSNENLLLVHGEGAALAIQISTESLFSTVSTKL